MPPSSTAAAAAASTAHPQSILKKYASRASAPLPDITVTSPSSSSAAATTAAATTTTTTTVVSTSREPTSAPRGTKPRPSSQEARRIALTLASSLQLRKAIEASILDSILELVDFPPPSSSPSSSPSPLHSPLHSSPSHSSSSPVSPAPPAEQFRRHLALFTPTDYDELLKERAILRKCGWCLCANGAARARGSGRTVLHKGRWVDRAAVERFCGDACAARAMAVRVQLRKDGAWVREDVVARVRVDESGAVWGLDGVKDGAAGVVLDAAELGAGAVDRVRDELERMGIAGNGDAGVRVRESEDEDGGEVAAPEKREGQEWEIEGFEVRMGRQEESDDDGDGDD